MGATIKSNRNWRHNPYQSQRGQIILSVVLVMGLAISASLYGVVRARHTTLEENAQTDRALALAKEALVSYASGRGSTTRPGELPCPDTDNSGIGAGCFTYIGRLPWKTLGMSDVRDGSGERLWYAVSSNFKSSPAVIPLNSNTSGQLTVTGIAPANNVIAIVFAPGMAVAGQSRSSPNANSVAHYLDGENANGDMIFARYDLNSTFNDRLLAITSEMFFPAVEMRVARELRSALNVYYASQRRFPPANAYGNMSCVTAAQGLIPQDPTGCGVSGPTIAAPSHWLTINEWFRVIFYAVAPACADTFAPDCTGAGGFLTVNGVGGIRALIIAPGTPFPGQNRPCGGNTDCLEMPNVSSFPVFTGKPGSATVNDKLVIVAP